MTTLFFNLKWYIIGLSARIGLYNPWKKNNGNLVIVTLHGICDDSRSYINGRFIRVSELQKLIFLLKDKTNIVTLDDVIHHRLVHEKMNVLIKFDDGYKNNLTLGLPILKATNCPATIFVTNQTQALWMDLIDVLDYYNPIELFFLKKRLKSNSNHKLKTVIKAQPALDVLAITEELQSKIQFIHPSVFNDYVALLDDRDLAELSQEPLISLANHGEYHFHVENLTNEEIIQEFENVKPRLQKYRNGYSNIISYPFGYTTPQIVSTLKKIGYDFQISCTGKAVLGSLRSITYNPFFSPFINLLALYHNGYK